MKRLVTLIFLSVSVGCATTPVTNRKQLNFIPEGQMNALGKQAYGEVLQKEHISKDKQLTERIEKIARRIAKASGVGYEWEFVLIDDPKTVNAFALPGGKIAVYTGILPVAQNDAALAAVLGHEVAHAVLKHGAERMSTAMAAQAGLAVASASFSDSRYRNLIAGALGVGMQFGVMLPYGRKHESEADMVGLQYMAKAGYDPREAVGLWQRMGKSGGGGPPEILSTHPDPARRARDIEAALPEIMPVYERSEKQPSQPF